MKKNIIFIAVAGVIFMSGAALADAHSFTAGYAQSKVKDYKNIKGINLQYRYEWNSPLSLIGSLTYLSNTDDINFKMLDEVNYKESTSIKYASLLVGPAYRFSEYISVYVAGGLAYTKSHAATSLDDFSADTTSKTNNFAYGAGIIVNPVEHMVVTAGYEGSKMSHMDEDTSINGFNVGIGYQF